jgi:hypothetical protein
MSEEQNPKLDPQNNTQPVNAANSTDELSEEELDNVAGGRKAGGQQQEYLIVKMEDILISS